MFIIVYILLMVVIFFLIVEPDGKKIPIPYSAVNSHVIPSLAYVTSKRQCRNMGCTRAIRIERCFWETVDGQALDRAVFWRLAAIRRLFVFCVECRWCIRMLPLNRKKTAFAMYESGVTLDFSSLGASASSFHFPSDLFLIYC